MLGSGESCIKLAGSHGCISKMLFGRFCKISMHNNDIKILKLLERKTVGCIEA